MAFHLKAEPAPTTQRTGFRTRNNTTSTDYIPRLVTGLRSRVGEAFVDVENIRCKQESVDDMCHIVLSPTQAWHVQGKSEDDRCAGRF
jgi:hypothetical protein